jgi:hypothetical protein
MHEGKRYVPTIHSPICGLVLAAERDHAPLCCLCLHTYVASSLLPRVCSIRSVILF